MTKQELLTKLAIDCATWADAMDAVVLLACGSGRRCASYGIAKQDWLAERERLLNLQWDGVPKRYKLAVIHANGKRWFFVNLPRLCEEWGSWELADGDGYHDYWEDENPPLAIPAGYDWRNSLEERPE